MIDTDKIVENLFRRHVPIADIAEGVELTIAQVTDIIIKKGLDWQNCNVVRDRNICDDYINGIKITELANKYKIERHGITNILRKQGVYQNRYASDDSIEKQKRNTSIKFLYGIGKSISEIANLTSINKSTVAAILRRLNVPMRPQHQKGHSKGTSKNRKYNYNRHYFDEIDDEHKAYWLGLIFADGNVHHRTGFQLGLKSSDAQILLKLQHDMKAQEVPLRIRANGNLTCLHLISQELVSALTLKGAPPKKTSILVFPTYNQVPTHLINHFMRGYFDGDGCVSIAHKEKTSPQLHFDVIGTYEFLSGYQDTLIKNTNALQKKSHFSYVSKRYPQIQRFAYTGNIVCKEIYNFLYKDATVFLERKKSIFEEIIRPS